MTFIEKLKARWQSTHSMLCVGLDPDLARLPQVLNDAHRDDKERVLAFNMAIVDATAALACSFKPQFAHYAAMQMEDVLSATITYIRDNYPDIPVVLDAKRGDIGSTAQRYAVEAFERYQADAVTVNPYLGFDSIKPFADYPDRGVIVLCRTSNPGSAEFQTLTVGDDGQPLYEVVAQRVSDDWNAHGNCCLVVGATYPEELTRVRQIVADMPILVPGVGAQGGDLDTVLRTGCTADGFGLMINSARGILYASNDALFADAARHEAALIQSACAQHIARTTG